MAPDFPEPFLDATLATAYVITKFVAPQLTLVAFDTLSGVLTVTKKDDLLDGNRVKLSGKAALYSEVTIYVEI